ncbi:hypothetical protein PACTADRAFT_50434 [Pachysolen tannophilus NRRL Y-2460]|uniref:Autophagy-related protein 33 n=1 Tax=Pachysolen tannophilus NRRL Y-2460 TaxID=669874 RepID=A0A1E4TS42_PACTA|nr:hypothetical protein PACTADRAFT_50434 [Pachysolen tannophilus NRRL Y-2460]
MGKCITTIKVIGTASLGLATGTAGIISLKALPNLISKNDEYSVTNFANAIIGLIYKARFALLSFGSLATSSLLLGFFQSPTRGQHPYLIYAAVGFPISLVYYAFKNFSVEKKLLAIKEKEAAIPTLKKKNQKNDGSKEKKEFQSSLDNSIYQDIASSTSQEDEDEGDVEDEVAHAIIKKEATLDLKKVQYNYKIITGIIGFAFAISTVGLIGDKY